MDRREAKRDGPAIERYIDRERQREKARYSTREIYIQRERESEREIGRD